MSLVPLRMGRLAAAGFNVQRSGVRWLCDDGHVCRPGEVIAFCNVGLTPTVPPQDGSRPFGDEQRDFQIAFAPRVGGRIHQAADSSLGGFLDQHHWYQLWTPDFVLGHVQCRPSERPPGYDSDGETLRLLLLAGRRTTEIAEVRSGLLTGWHDRSRAWWGEGDGDFGTLLSLGICEHAGIIRGDQFAFLELFETVRGPAQAVFVPDDALIPCAPVIAEQLYRTPALLQDIAADFAQSFPTGPMTPAPSEWIFAGSLLAALQRSPLTEHYDILTRNGLRRTGPADAVILSLNAESASILRHRRLGYAVQCHAFRIAEAGPAVRAWLQSNFEVVKRTPDDIRRDYRDLFDAVRARSDMQFLILNVMSTSGHEDVHNYAPFSRPLGDTLSTIRSKELNLMLHDFTRERDVAIVDVDAVAAELGAYRHLPDGMHHSGPMQAEVREEIVRILRARGVTGFGSPPVR